MTSLLLLAATAVGSGGCHVHVAGGARHHTDTSTAAPGQPAVIAAPERAPLVGRWTDGDLVLEIERDEAGFTVAYPNGRGPFSGRFLSEDEIWVSFYDDPGCCTGRVDADGSVIRWSNGGSWQRLGALETATSMELILRADAR